MEPRLHSVWIEAVFCSAFYYSSHSLSINGTIRLVVRLSAFGIYGHTFIYFRVEQTTVDLI